jgi:hypothetical protein
VTVVTNYIFLRGQPKRRLRDRWLGPLTAEEQIRKHNYILKLPATVRLHIAFRVNNLRPCSNASLRPVVPVTTPIDDDKYGVSHIYVVCIEPLIGTHDKY